MAIAKVIAMEIMIQEEIVHGMWRMIAMMKVTHN